MPRIASTRPSTVRRVASALASGSLLAGSVAPVTAQDRTPLVVAQAAPAPTAPAPAASPFNAEQKAAIEAIIKEYFLKNPEAMLEIQTALEAKMEKIQSEKLVAALKDNAGDIYRRANSPIAGNPSGDVTVVEFFDYNCGYCKRAFSDIAKLVEKDPKVRLVMKELPILTKGSEEASRVAIAAKLQGKYWEAHRALISLKGEVNEQSALKAVEKIGLDMAKLKKDMESPEVKGEIAFVRELAQKMGIQGTPHFLVGDKPIAGAPQNLLEQMTGYVADVRKSGCKFC